MIFVIHIWISSQIQRNIVLCYCSGACHLDGDFGDFLWSIFEIVSSNSWQNVNVLKSGWIKERWFKYKNGFDCFALKQSEQSEVLFQQCRAFLFCFSPPVKTSFCLLTLRGRVSRVRFNCFWNKTVRDGGKDRGQHIGHQATITILKREWNE